VNASDPAAFDRAERMLMARVAREMAKLGSEGPLVRIDLIRLDPTVKTDPLTAS
jgi:hypothetical protein